jgi:Putative transposase
MQDSLPAGGLRLYREGVEPSGSLRKVSGYISILLSRTSPVARVVYAKPPFAGPEAVLAYLSRYTHRVAISNRRLIAFDKDGVTFRYKDYRRNGPERRQAMTLDTREFMRRFLLHVLPRGFHRIRHYGLLASATRKASIAQARELLGQAPPPEPAEPMETSDPTPPCPCCGGRMRIIEIFGRWCQPRAPPPAHAPTGMTSP